VDDVVVKTRNSDMLITDLEEPSDPYKSTNGSSNHLGNYSASSSAIVASKPTPRRSPPSPT
jgi:hypothetical protein